MLPDQNTTNPPTLVDFDLTEEDVHSIKQLKLYKGPSGILRGVVSIVAVGATVVFLYAPFVQKYTPLPPGVWSDWYLCFYNPISLFLIIGLLLGIPGLLGQGLLYLIWGIFWLLFFRHDSLSRNTIKRYKCYQAACDRYKLIQSRRQEEQRRALEQRQEEIRLASEKQQKQQKQNQVDYWKGLSPYEFEHEVAALYTKLGKKVSVTSGSGDKGIDILINDGKSRIIVQCKRYKNPTSPATVRELYGAMIADGADKAILVCTGGFTSGVRKFVRGKPIKLIDMDGLLKLVERAGDK